MNIIKVKDYDSMQAITVSLAKNGYLVTADSVTDEHYKEHWEIKYCELSEITEKPNNNDNYSDFDGDYLGSMEINNKDNTKGVKCKILSDEKPSVGNDIEVINPHGSLPKHIDPESEPVIFDLDKNDVILDVNPLLKNEEIPIWKRDPNFKKPVQFDEKGNIIKNDEKPLVENEKEIIDPIPTKSVQKHKKYIDIPIINQDVSNNITDEPMTVITSVSGN